jgi:hypothetical protein
MSTRTQTRVKAAPKPTFTPVQGGLLQRKCACASAPGLTGECDDCRKKRLTSQRRSDNQAEPSTVPPIVHEVLQSPGQPLAPATRVSMEPRFGHDFSQVRVHTDAQEVLRSSGQPLDANTRASMESRFGHDFGRVSVYSRLLELCGQTSCPGSEIKLFPDFGKEVCPAGPVILHEAAHNAEACDDIDKGKSYPPTSAENNAYSYEYFALAIAAGYKSPELGTRKPSAPKVRD